MDMSTMFGGGSDNKILNRFFRKVDSVVWDLMTGKLGIKTGEGILTLDGEGDDAQVSMNLFDNFGVSLPAFAQNTPIDAIKSNDLIFGEKKILGWVVKVPTGESKTFILLKPDGTRGEWRPPKVQSIGLDLNGAMVLRSLINTLPEGGLSNMQNMLMPMLMMGGDAEGLDGILPALLFTQMNNGGKADASNPMGNMLQTMMMMKMMGGMSKPSGSVGGKVFSGGGAGKGEFWK